MKALRKATRRQNSLKAIGGQWLKLGLKSCGESRKGDLRRQSCDLDVRFSLAMFSNSVSRMRTSLSSVFN